MYLSQTKKYISLIDSLEILTTTRKLKAIFIFLNGINFVLPYFTL
jgi:hypothetical protein